MMFVKQYAPKQMLAHKGGQINNVQLITGMRIAEMSQIQNCSLGGGGGQGGCEQRIN